jgi:L-lactate dehydrogenase
MSGSGDDGATNRQARTVMKIGIVGTGAVGAACLNAVVARGFAEEIVVLDRDRKKAEGLVADIQYGATLSSSTTIREGDYADFADAALVMITAGVNEKTGGATDRGDPAGRLRLLDTNVGVYKDVVPHLHAAAPEAVVLVVTDPPDPLADLVRMLGHKRVLSTGTYLDSLRFRFHLALHLGVNPRSVEAQILGEHGTSEVFIWSSARVGGTPARELLERSSRNWNETRTQIEREVRYANISIIEGIGASQHGIGMVSARIAEIIVRDERVVIPVGSYHPDHQVTLSLPTVLGRGGALQVIEPELSDEERQALERSVQTLKAAVARMGA